MAALIKVTLFRGATMFINPDYIAHVIKTEDKEDVVAKIVYEISIAASSRIEVYRIAAEEWERLAPMLTPQSAPKQPIIHGGPGAYLNQDKD